MPPGNDINSDVTPGDAQGRDTPLYTLTVEEASELFARAGVPRSIRSIQRFCRKGHLDAITFDTEIGDKYLITRESVDRRVQELQQIERVTSRDTDVAARRDEARHDASRHDTSRHDAPERDTDGAREKITELESKVRMLEIDKAVREQLLDRMNEDRERILDQMKGYIGDLVNQSRTIGQLETKLQLLNAPTDIPRRVHVISDSRVAAEDITVPSPRFDATTGDNVNSSASSTDVE